MGIHNMKEPKLKRRLENSTPYLVCRLEKVKQTFSLVVLLPIRNPFKNVSTVGAHRLLQSIHLAELAAAETACVLAFGVFDFAAEPVLDPDARRFRLAAEFGVGFKDLVGGGPRPGMTIPHCFANTHCTS